MSREELINLVKIIMAGGEDENTGKSYTESELDKLIVLFEKSIPNKNGSDLIFYPNLCGLSGDPTAEEIVEAALHE